jgi:exodeoxyribonuclease VII large subunit
VVLVSVPVQGDLAPELIARALRHLGRVPGVDVVVVARGGGSLEDLMAFNSEVVCRAVAAVPVPVVSAVGHERDVTVCDLVADLRVSAPSAAAEAVLPSLEALEVRLGDGAQALVRALRGRGDRAGDRVDGLAGRLAPALARLAARAPGEVAAREALLRRAASARAESAAGRLERVQALLSLLSPGRTVARGYAIVRDAASDGVIASAAAVAPGQELSIELRDGRVPARAGEAA